MHSNLSNLSVCDIGHLVELRDLRYFISVSDNFAFSRTAANLGLSRSALSPQIKSLEDETRSAAVQSRWASNRSDSRWLGRSGPSMAALEAVGHPQTGCFGPSRCFQEVGSRRRSRRAPEMAQSRLTRSRSSRASPLPLLIPTAEDIGIYRAAPPSPTSTNQCRS
jgi:hypothetical protein